MAGKTSLELRVAVNGDDQVVPPAHLRQIPCSRRRFVRTQRQRLEGRTITIGDAHAHAIAAVVRDRERNCILLLVVRLADVEIRSMTAAERAFEAAEESVGSVDRQVVLSAAVRTERPPVLEVLVRLDRVGPWRVDVVPRTNL